MQGTVETKRKVGIRMVVQSSLIGLACGLAYELMGLLLQFAWSGIEIYGGPVSQVRFMQSFTLGLLIVAVAGFLPAAIFKISRHELLSASITGAVSGILAGVTLVLFDYMQHFQYFTDRALSLSSVGYALNIVAISPQFVLLMTAACAMVGAISALLYVIIDMEIG